MYVFMVIIAVKQVVYLASMGVKIKHTVGGQSQVFFSKYITDSHASRNMDHN